MGRTWDGARREPSARRSRRARFSPATASTWSAASSAAARAQSWSADFAANSRACAKSGIHSVAFSPILTNWPTPSKNPTGSLSGCSGPTSANSQRSAMNRSLSAASGSNSRLARSTVAVQPRATPAAVGRPPRKMPAPLPSCGIATVSVEWWPTGKATLPAGNEMPSMGAVGGRGECNAPCVNATAMGRGDSFSTSMMVSPPWSGTEYTRCTASPSGMRTRVSTTAVPSTRRCRTAASCCGLCQRSSAAMCQSSGTSPPQGSMPPQGVTVARHPPPVTPVVMPFVAPPVLTESMLIPSRSCGCAASANPLPLARGAPGDTQPPPAR